MERLLPSFAVELRSKLLAEAQDAVLLQVSDKLWDWASQAPTQVRPCTNPLSASMLSELVYCLGWSTSLTTPDWCMPSTLARPL